MYVVPSQRVNGVDYFSIRKLPSIFMLLMRCRSVEHDRPRSDSLPGLYADAAAGAFCNLSEIYYREDAYH